MMLTFSNSGWMHFSEPQLMTHIPPGIHLPQRPWWFPWTWLKRQDLQQTHSSNMESPPKDISPSCYNPHLWHVTCLLSLPNGYCLLCAFPPIEKSQQLTSGTRAGDEPWECKSWIYGLSWTASTCGSGRLNIVQSAQEAVHGKQQLNAHGSLWTNICWALASISKFPHIQPKHTTKNCYTTAAFIPKRPT